MDYTAIATEIKESLQTKIKGKVNCYLTIFGLFEIQVTFTDLTGTITIDDVNFTETVLMYSNEKLVQHYLLKIISAVHKKLFNFPNKK